MVEAEDPRVKMGYLREMCHTKLKTAQELQDEMIANDIQMNQDVRYWWEVNQHHRLWQQLDEALLTLATDSNSEQMDHETFIGKYEWHVRSYLSEAVTHRLIRSTAI
jgi:hypothetical protein